MILAWSLSNTNILIGDALVTENLPPFVPSKISGSKSSVFGSKWFIVGACSCGCFLLVTGRYVVKYLVIRKEEREREVKVGDCELEY